MHMFVPTQQQLESRFAMLNAMFFNGALDVDELEIDTSGDDFCGAGDDNNEIVIVMCNEYDDEQQFINLLAHEMTHVWQIMNDLPGGHDGAFAEKAVYFQQFGITI